ncbi:MAG TPA: hypothetical protein VJT32_12445 [bacterium]|nr:hypothetical protein [bacterium]
MEQQERRSLARDAEEVIRRLRGVSAVRVELGGNGRIEQVHVLGSADRTARVIAADVVAALGAELGEVLEPSQIRVAVLRPGQTQPGPAPLRARLKFVGLSLATLRQSLEVRVQVEHEGLTYEGTAAGGGTQGEEIVGQAALRAVETYLRSDGVFHLKTVTVVPLGTQRVALALVAWDGPEQELLSGAAVVRDDPRDAVVRAVLDAVNRPVSWLGGR